MYHMDGFSFNMVQVEDLIGKLGKELGNTYNQEIDHLINSASSYVSAAINEAEKNGFEINVDVDFIDNKFFNQSIFSYLIREAMESLKAATKLIAKRVFAIYCLTRGS